MSELSDSSGPVSGLYEQLVTLRLEAQLKELAGRGGHAIDDVVGPESSPASLHGTCPTQCVASWNGCPQQNTYTRPITSSNR